MFDSGHGFFSEWIGYFRLSRTLLSSVLQRFITHGRYAVALVAVVGTKARKGENGLPEIGIFSILINRMTNSFELNTLKIRIADPKLAPLELRIRVQRALRQLILDGVLAPGCRLTDTRTLSKSLNVSRDTIEMAYVQLRLDGYVSRRAGSGRR